MLFEMLQGEVLPADWKNEAVKRALDLCLSCKACKTECPTNVDIASYRAEFLSHYYAEATRPLHAYLFGMIDLWAYFASFSPAFVNFVGDTPTFRLLLSRVLHTAPERRLPKFARRTFRSWARKHGLPITSQRNQRTFRVCDRPEVVLWVDTFNNYFNPQTSISAVKLLEAAGFLVTIPAGRLCCGRPLYDYGFLSHAKVYLARILDALDDVLAAGKPIVVLEPSCASVFRDELRNLFPDDPRAARLSQLTFLLSEFLQHHVPDYKPPTLSCTVLLHGHCHQKALWTMTDEETLLRKMGVQLEPLDSGCCGMAGPFGYGAEKYTVSQAIAERVLLPAVRRADAATLIVSSGFSCREQILQATGRRAMHLAEAMTLALGRQSAPTG
jgi:Fe-S oxidoreductase